MNIDSISFGAIPLNKVTIKKYQKGTNSFTDFPAFFVKIEATKDDLSAINWTAQTWKKAKYIQRIATAAHWMNVRDFVEIDVYALTTQVKNFNKLKPNKILGFAEMRNNCENPNDRIINYLQVKPLAQNVNNDKKKKYKHVGKAILDSLKKIYSSMSLYSEDDKNIKKFYRSNGFIEDCKAENHFSWCSNLFNQLKIRVDKFLRENHYKMFDY